MFGSFHLCLGTFFLATLSLTTNCNELFNSHSIFITKLKRRTLQVSPNSIFQKWKSTRKSATAWPKKCKTGHYIIL